MSAACRAATPWSPFCRSAKAAKPSTVPRVRSRSRGRRRHRRAAGRDRHRRRQRRRNQQDQLRDLCEGSADRLLRSRARPSRQAASRSSSRFPEFRRRWRLLSGTRPSSASSCIGPVAVRDRDGLAARSRNMRSARDAAGPVDAFLNAASPGVVASFLPNKYYPTHEAYVEAVADGDARGIRGDRRGGLHVQIDCPDLAMSRHTGFPGPHRKPSLSSAREFHVEALNHALAQGSRRQGARPRVLGQLRRAAHP